MKKLPISTIILAHQHSPALKRAIESVSFADEIVLIDTSGSGAITQKDFPHCKIETLPIVKNFAQTRNQTLAFAKHSWVFFLDSDEQCVAPNLTKLAALLDKPLAVYQVKRTDYFLGKPLRFGEPGNTWLIRFVPKAYVEFSGAVHEHILSPLTAKRIPANLCTLNHFSHSSVSSFFQKISWYAKLEAEQRSTPLSLVWLELAIFPLAKFFYNFVVLAGWLDGVRGLVYATLMSYHSALVRMYQIEQRLTK